MDVIFLLLSLLIKMLLRIKQKTFILKIAQSFLVALNVGSIRVLIF